MERVHTGAHAGPWRRWGLLGGHRDLIALTWKRTVKAYAHPAVR